VARASPPVAVATGFGIPAPASSPPGGDGSAGRANLDGTARDDARTQVARWAHRGAGRASISVSSAFHRDDRRALSTERINIRSVNQMEDQASHRKCSQPLTPPLSCEREGARLWRGHALAERLGLIDELLARFPVAGTPEDCRRRLEALRAAGIENV